MWGADYPHSEGQTGAVESLKQSLSNLPEDARRKIIGENAIRLYGLS
jgi:predicted TIM-barrel fold metal-dependent hydrolase